MPKFKEGDLICCSISYGEENKFPIRIIEIKEIGMEVYYFIDLKTKQHRATYINALDRVGHLAKEVEKVLYG